MNMIGCNGERADGLVQSVVISSYVFNLKKLKMTYRHDVGRGPGCEDCGLPDGSKS